jgi:parvulin-like peptidyl-prolyl isomerase
MRLGKWRTRARSAAAVAAVAVGLAACGGQVPPGPDVVARIGAMEVHSGEFEAYLDRMIGDPEAVLASEVLSQLFDQFLDERILVQLARDRKLIAREGTVRPRLAIDALLREELAEEPSEQEIAAWYAAHRAEFSRPERVRVRQILTEDRAEAEEASRQLAAGADFEALARRLSRDPSAASGGVQGEMSREDLPPAFADVIFALPPGGVSAVVPAAYGFHVFQVVQRSPAEVVPLHRVRAEVAERLRQERADRRVAELVREGRAHYNVVVYDRNLPFNYQGSHGHDNASKAR